VWLPRNLPERGALRYLSRLAPAWPAGTARVIPDTLTAAPSRCSPMPPPRL